MREPEHPRTELLVALATDTVSAWYFAWMTLQLLRNTQAFARMYEGLGAELPAATDFLVKNGLWFYPAVFGVLLLLLIGKELLIKDKRLSAMVACLLAVAGQFTYHWLTTVYYLPMFDMIRKLG